MDPNSKNKHILSKKLDFKKISIQKKVNITPTPKTIYPIRKILRTDYTNIELNSNQRIFVCIYQINHNAKFPFLEYTLWKYPKSNKSYSDLLVFPFIKYNNQNALIQANGMKDKLRKEKSILKGFLLNKNGAFFFYEDEISFNKLKTQLRSKKKWWVTIDEICNHRNMLKFPIHNTVFNLFFQNPKLIYLFDQNNRKIEIPSIAYWGDHSKLLPMVAVFGLRKFRRNTFGPFYYFSSYNAAIRYSAWTRNYKPFQISGKNLTNSEGRWKSSGIIRFVLFLGKTKVMLNHPDDVKNKIAQVSIYKNILDPASNWSNRYDSVYVGRAKLQNGFVVRSNPQFVVRRFDQQHPLSIHIIDPKTIQRTWQPTYLKYYIK